MSNPADRSAPVPHDPPTLGAGATAAAPTWRAAYSDRTAALMAAFSQMAYLPFGDERAAGPRTAKSEQPGGRQALIDCLGPDFSHVDLFNKDDAQAFLAVGATFAVLAFRGTANFRDWLTDLNAVLTPLKGAPADVWVHAGFLSAFECCRQDIEAAVNAHVPSDLGLYITGHSLGGALAQIASAALERDNLAACYTFGSPRVGTLDFDVQVKCPHYRLTNDWDLVPGVPPPWNWGYHHTGDPRLLEPGPKLFRRDRGVLSRLLVDVAASLVSLFSKTWLAVDDHMIWNYRTALDAIAASRSPRTAGAAQAGARQLAPGARRSAQNARVIGAKTDSRPLVAAVLLGVFLMWRSRHTRRPPARR